MNTIYKSVQAALIAKDYNKVALVMLQQDFDYVIGDTEYMLSVYNHKTGNTDLQLRTNDAASVLLNTF